MNDRITKIKKRLFDVEFLRQKEWWGEGKTILTDEQIKTEPLIVRKAKAIRFVLTNMPIKIYPDELIVGIANMAMVGFGRVFPDYALPEEKEKAAKVSLSQMSVWGHHPGKYGKVLTMGLSGIRKQVMDMISRETAKGNPDHHKLDFYRAVIISLNAVKDFASRYSELALKMSVEETDSARRQELLSISEICHKVSEEPAGTFQEALQSFWFFYAALHSCLEFVPAGRSDQYLYPYYKRDLEEKRITPSEAREMVASWLVKFNERVEMKPEYWKTNIRDKGLSQGADPTDKSLVMSLDNEKEYNYGLSANTWLMNMILGGQTYEGEDATNELTYLLLETWSSLEIIAPVMSVRFHKGSPPELYDSCAKILRTGSGEPALYNDEPIIDSLIKLGIPIEDARDYSNDGCWEILIPGRTDFSFVFVSMLQLLEYVFFRGHSLVRETKEAGDTGDPTSFRGFEDFYAAFKTQLEERIEHLVRNKLKYYGAVSRIAPDPLLSAVMDHCIEKGLDVTEGGAKYIIHALMFAGLAHCVDSLAAVKKFVYEEKAFSMAELVEALKTNFVGRETLRQMLIGRAPKFGNDIPYVDQLASRVLADTVAKVKRMQAEINWMYLPLGIATFEHYAMLGNGIGASADGRLAREALSTNYSPAVGLERKGPTAVVRSITYPDLNPYTSGAALDVQFDSNAISEESGVGRLVGFIKSFLELGGLILTVNVTSVDTLKDAQKNPEKHRNLRVRLGGFSTYFVTLPQKHQEIIIQRTKHGI